MMEIDVKVFEEFMKKLTLKGNINSCIIQSDKASLFSRVTTLDNIFYCKTLMPKKVLKTFESELRISLGAVEAHSDVILILNTIKNMTGILKVKVDENTLFLECGDDSAQIILTSEEFVLNNSDKEPKLQFEKGFDVSKDVLNKVLNNIGAMTTKDNTPNVRIKIENKTCYFVVEKDENKLITKMQCSVSDRTTKINGGYFAKIVQSLGDKINFSFENNEMPIQIKDMNDKISAQYIIAPIVEIEGEEEEKTKKTKKEETTGEEKK